ncbi:hypothetical protein OG241_32570 [Streptomyces sp. NBC_01390]|uniref:hypothetical protein n=1 Tax=Streptomyces sp. NBC_01390 TaxID=2903850 RepID=UPI0032501896
MTSNDIRFECRHRGDGGPLVITPRIDGAPLTELIDGFEIAAGMQPAGDAWRSDPGVLPVRPDAGSLPRTVHQHDGAEDTRSRL